MCTGSKPFPQLTDIQVHFAIATEDRMDQHQSYSALRSDKLRRLWEPMLGCWKLRGGDRPDANAFLVHVGSPDL